MIKFLLLLIPFASFGQFTIDRVAYDPSGPNDTLWTRDGSNKDTLFRRTAGVFNFAHRPLFRKFWTTADLPDFVATETASFALKQNTLVSGTNIKTVNGNSLVGSGDVSISSSVAWGGVTGTLSNQTDLNNALNLKAPLASPTFTGTVSGVTASHVGLGNVNNTSDANKPVSTATQTALDGKLATNGSAANLTAFPTLNQNTTGTAAGLSAVLSFANGGISTSAATSATTGTMTVNMTSSMITITPTGACTFNASGGVAGQIVTFLITTSGVTSFTLTWGTNYRKVGTLSTGTVSARFFSVTFRCINGTIWQEISRTAAQT